MRRLGLKGARRGKPVKTTVSDRDTPVRRIGLTAGSRRIVPIRCGWPISRMFQPGRGFVYVAFVIDVFARYIVGWKVSCSARTDFVLDALEQALHARQPFHQGSLIHHSDCGVQYVSIRYTERLTDAGVEPSVGSVGTPTIMPSPKPSMGCTRPS